MNEELVKILRKEQESYKIDTQHVIQSRGFGKTYMQMTRYFIYYVYSLLCDALILCDEEWTLDEAHAYIADFVNELWYGEEENNEEYEKDL